MENIDYNTLQSLCPRLEQAASRVYQLNPEPGNGYRGGVTSGHSFRHALENKYDKAQLALSQAFAVLHPDVEPKAIEERMTSMLTKPGANAEGDASPSGSAEVNSWEPFYVTRLQLNAWLNELDEGSEPAKVFNSIPQSANPERPTDDLFSTSEDELKALGATAMPWPRQVILEMLRDGEAIIGKAPAEETVVVDAVQVRYWLTRASNGSPIDQFIQTALETPIKDGSQLIEVPRQSLEDVLIVEGSENKAAELEYILEHYSTSYAKPVIESDNSTVTSSTGGSPVEGKELSADTQAIIEAIEKLGITLGYKITGGE